MTLPEVAAASTSLLPIQIVTKVGLQRHGLLQLACPEPAQHQVVQAAGDGDQQRRAGVGAGHRQVVVGPRQVQVGGCALRPAWGR